MFEINGKYLYYKDGMDEEPIEVTFRHILRHDSERVAVFEHNKRTVWVYESKWKYIKEP